MSTSGPLGRRSITHDARATAGATMTPMVDVVLVILIFFMGSATIAGNEWFLRAAVDSGEDAAQTDEGAALSIPVPVFRVRLERSGGSTQVSGVAPDAVGVVEAAERVASIAFGGASVVELSATDDVPLGDVVLVHDALNARGVKVTLR